MKYAFIALSILILTAILYVTMFAGIKPPTLSDSGLRGQIVFENKCAMCHGPLLGGTEQGPPLVHHFYRPSHHDDQSIKRAVRSGVIPHHWNFGEMPPIDDISESELDDVITFIRDSQRANGIF